MLAGAWPQAALAHGEEAVVYVFGTLFAAAALFGLVGGAIFKRRGAAAWRGYGMTYGVYLAALALVVLALLLLDGEAGSAMVVETVFFMLLIGGTLSAPVLGAGYALTRYLSGAPRTRA